MAKPRVLMLGWEFPPLVSGGLGVACEGLVAALRRTTELTLMIPHRPETPAPSSIVGLPLSPYPDHPGDLYGPNLSDEIENFSARASSRVDELDFDLIHAHDWMTAQAGLAIKARTGKPLVFHLHSLNHDRVGPKQGGWIDDLERTTIQKADLVVTVSQYTRAICLTHYRADPNKTVVVHNGLRPILPYRSPRPFPASLVIFVGRLVSQKNPAHFLEIARRVLDQNPRVRFAMAGAGHPLRRLMAHALRLGISDKVHFTGFLNREQVHHLYSMADVCCLPSASEPFGLVALEAAQFGVPVVISEKSGVSEILPDAKTASPGDLETFSSHILDFLSQDGPKPFLPIRTWDQAATELMSHYQNLLNSAPLKTG